MDLKKRKYFTPKKKGRFLRSLFRFFSFQTRKDLPLVKFYNAAVRKFLKTFTKFAGKRL